MMMMIQLLMLQNFQTPSCRLDCLWKHQVRQTEELNKLVTCGDFLVQLLAVQQVLAGIVMTLSILLAYLYVRVFCFF